MSVDQLALLGELCGLRRDLVSDGYAEALAVLRRRFPLGLHEYPSGMRCWTWVVPEKWSCTEAFIESAAGRRIIDQSAHPLHVASYSVPLDRWVERAELLEHVHVHPHVPTAPPFVFHYYQRNWGFAATWSQRAALTDDRYRVVVRSRLEPGVLKVGEWLLPGEREECFVLAAHLCHPAQANDGLSGVLTGLAAMTEWANRSRRRYTYRLLVVPETIGSVAWLSSHEEQIPRLAGGLFLDMTGLDNPPALQLSYGGHSRADHCCQAVHVQSEPGAWVAPYRGVVGNDERQFNAPGVRVPMVSYSRARPADHPLRPYREYHSAADDMGTVSAAALESSRRTVLDMLEAWEEDYRPRNRFKGEVFLAGCDLAADRAPALPAHRNMLRIMDCLDGELSVAEVALRLELPYAQVRDFIERLRARELVEPLELVAPSPGGDQAR